MTSHPYLRAYMAGIVVPTLFLLIGLSAFCVVRFGYAVPVPLERVMVFPMAIVPNLFGLWNIFYVWLRPRRHLPIGVHGALLPFVVAPLAVLLGTLLGLLSITSRGFVYLQAFTIPYPSLVTLFCFALTVYYLVWKYLVGFFNEVLGIA